MAKHITRGATSSVVNPILDTFIAVDGLLVEPVSLSFAIYDISTPTNEATPVEVVTGTPIDLQAALVSPGRYAATWSVPNNEALGRHVIQWTAQLVSGGPTVQWAYAFDVVVGVFNVPADVYASVSDVRAEGVPASISDARILEQLALASRRLDNWTGRSFVPKYKTVGVDGQQRDALWLDEAICAIEQVQIAAWEGYINPGEFVVYNRHLTQNLLSPDDRDFPQIAYRLRGDYALYSSSYITWTTPSWLASRRLSWGNIGRQSVRIMGVFGYTEYDGSPCGRTPILARDVTVRIALKTLKPAYQTGGVGVGGGVWNPGGAITEMRTREQVIRWSGPTYGANGSAFNNMARYTGDPIVDSMIEQLCRPIVGAVV